MAFNGNPTQEQRIAEEVFIYKQIIRHTSYDLRVAMPGIIASFDPNKLTVTVDIAVRDKLKIKNEYVDKQIPRLLDVPLMLPHGGNFAVTIPVQAGDECLVIMADMCINSWWANGGIQNQEVDRRHDFSDGFAVLAPWSQATKIGNFNTNAAEIRTVDNSTKVSVTPSNVNIVATTTDINSLLSLHGTLTPHPTTADPAEQLLHVTINGQPFGIKVTPA